MTPSAPGIRTDADCRRSRASTRTPPCKTAAPRNQFEAVGLRDPDEQFVTYHQPGRRRVPLPPDRLVELEWWSRHRLEDFLSACARRRGGRPVVDRQLLGAPMHRCILNPCPPKADRSGFEP